MPELRHLTENLTDNQKKRLFTILILGEEQITTEDGLMDIVSDVNETRDPEHEAFVKKTKCLNFDHSGQNASYAIVEYKGSQ